MQYATSQQIDNVISEVLERHPNCVLSQRTMLACRLADERIKTRILIKGLTEIVEGEFVSISHVKSAASSALIAGGCYE